MNAKIRTGGGIRAVAVLLAMLCALLLALTACVGGEPNPDKIPVKDWKDYLNDVAVAIDLQYAGVDVKEPVTADIRFEAVDGNTSDRYEGTLALNLALDSRTGQQGVWRLERVRGESRRVLMDVYTQDDMLYWCMWDESNQQYERTSFRYAPLLYTVIRSAGLLSDGIDYSTPGKLFVAFGKAFFTDGTANEGHTAFAFRFDLHKGLESAFAREAFGQLPEVARKFFLSVAKTNDYDDMLARTPQLSGTVRMETHAGKLDRIYSEDLRYIDEKADTDVTLRLDVPVLTIANGRNAELDAYAPDPSQYTQGRLCDVTANGTLNLDNAADGRTEMQYDYEFRAKIDLLEWIAAGGDLRALPQDNFFHMRVSHACGDACGAYCRDKLDPAKGAVLDIAFSPKDFGTYDLYISVGLRAWLAPRVLEGRLKWAQSLLIGQIPEYYLFVVSADTLQRKLAPNASVADDRSDAPTSLMDALVYEDGALSITAQALLNAADADEATQQIVGELLRGGGYAVDTVRLRQEYLRWQVAEYDVMRSAIHLYGKDVAGTKQYTRGLLTDPPAVAYEFEKQNVQTVDRDMPVVRLYRDEYADGVLYDAATPICAQEISAIAGAIVHAQATDIYGDASATTLRVIGHSAIDPAASGWQRVELYCLPEGDGYLSEKIWESIRGQTWGEWLSVHVTTYIRLQALEDVDFRRQDKTQYRQGERLAADDAPEIATAILSYRGNKTKQVRVQAKNASELLLTDQSNRRFVRADRDTVLQFYLFGTYYGSTVRVQAAQATELVASATELTLQQNDNGYASDLRVARMRWTLDDGTQSEATLPLEYMTLNGYAIDEPNEYFALNLMLGNIYVVFLKTGRYTLVYRCDGQQIELPLYIAPRAETSDDSRYTVQDTTGEVGHYFVGYSYAFSGAIVNTYHGEHGKRATLRIEILRGEVNASGGLSYRAIQTPQEYYRWDSVNVDGADAQTETALDLPPTIYGKIDVRAKATFVKAGYYKVRIGLDSDWSYEREIRVETVPE